MPERAGPFREMIMARYPWLTASSVDVLMELAIKEMRQVLDEETSGRSAGRTLADSGRVDEAIEHLTKSLERDPEDADSWYLLGELLCRAGRSEEGYRAFAEGRKRF